MCYALCLLVPFCFVAQGRTVGEDLLKQATEASERGQHAKALALADKAIEQDPKNIKAYAFRGALQDLLGKHKDAVADFGKAIELDPKLAEAYDRRGSSYFKLGDFAASIKDFDKYLELEPRQVPGHWRRGISYYYAKRYDEGRKQFEGYEQVDTNDVENAVFRWLCMVPLVGVDKAQAALLKIGNDKRIPMMKIFALYSGQAKPADVLAAAEEGKPTAGELLSRRFYAHLYLGLYYDAIGDKKQALVHLNKATDDYKLGGYMWDVARVHRDLLRKGN
jgi:lipoprotein NlpI